MTKTYQDFIAARSQWRNDSGFEPTWIPDCLFDFQRHLTEWSIRQGRAALFEDCGLGKTVQQLVWAQNVVERTNLPVMLATPIAVGAQTVKEAEKFGINARRTKDGFMDGSKCIWVTNYEQLHKYDPSQFGGCVCDESSAIKDFKSERKKVVVEFMRRLDYRLLCTATAAPNDYWELGTSSEALGHMGFRDMLTAFFKMEQSKGGLAWGREKYRFRGHAEQPFWSWVCSWARSIQKPSDLGFSDDDFVLPKLTESEIVIDTASPRPGMLFSIPARDLREERAERRHSIEERCQRAAEIANGHDGPSVLWCELNDEGNALERHLPGSVQIHGSMADDAREEALLAFSSGEIRQLITKPKIGAWGLNWQHCSNVITFPSHSFEQYYQAVRRCYRFGQKRPVNVSLIVCEGERGILANLQRKQIQARKMFESIVRHMADAMHIATGDSFAETESIPDWIMG